MAPKDILKLCEEGLFQAGHAINITDTEGALIKVNAAYLKLYGFADEKEVLGKTQRIIRSKETPRSLYDAMWKTIRSGEVWTGNIVNTAKDGAPVFVNLSISPIKRKGRIVAYMGFSLDRAQQMALELQLFHANKLVLLGTLSASLAHELNNPLASILLDAEFLRDATLPGVPAMDPSALHEASLSLVSRADRMKKVIEHLLLYSRKDSAFARSTISIDALVEDSLMFTAKKLENKGIRIEISLQEDLYVAGNRTQMESVLHNLLSNSGDAFENSTSRDRLISIRARREASGGILIDYSDNAGGIPKPIQARIFEPFFTTKRESEGTGLGLAISKRIITEHGGAIECDSKEGMTHFAIRLPSTAFGGMDPEREDDSRGINLQA